VNQPDRQDWSYGLSPPSSARPRRARILPGFVFRGDDEIRLLPEEQVGRELGNQTGAVGDDIVPAAGGYEVVGRSQKTPKEKPGRPR